MATKGKKMKAAAENYKGISYVRISSLPSGQKKLVWKTIDHNLIIKILIGDALINDCLQYEHYLTWYENSYVVSLKAKPIEIPSSPVGDFAIAS